MAAYIAKSVINEGETFLKHASWVIVMIANPDGYEHTHVTDRFWRKNRSLSNNSSCIGVDLNRNWGHSWSITGTSNDPCTEIYHGAAAFSEPEVAGIAKFVMAFKSQVSIYEVFLKLVIH